MYIKTCQWDSQFSTVDRLPTPWLGMLAERNGAQILPMVTVKKQACPNPFTISNILSVCYHITLFEGNLGNKVLDTTMSRCHYRRFLQAKLLCKWSRKFGKVDQNLHTRVKFYKTTLSFNCSSTYLNLTTNTNKLCNYIGQVVSTAWTAATLTHLIKHYNLVHKSKMLSVKDVMTIKQPITKISCHWAINCFTVQNNLLEYTSQS